MYTVTKDFFFEAAHSLPHLPPGHKCRNLHGHSYRVRVECDAAELNRDGFVVDYGEISRFMDPVVQMLDHHNLNDVLHLPTTAENLAAWIYQKLKEEGLGNLSAVVVFETAKTSATYFEDKEPASNDLMPYGFERRPE